MVPKTPDTEVLKSEINTNQWCKFFEISVVNVQVLILPILQKTQFGQMATIVAISG